MGGESGRGSRGSGKSVFGDRACLRLGHVSLQSCAGGMRLTITRRRGHLPFWGSTLGLGVEEGHRTLRLGG